MASHNFFELASVDSAILEDATPRVLGPLSFLDNSVFIAKVEVVALRQSDMAVKAWTLEVLLRRSGGAVTLLESIPSPANIFANAADATALSAVTIALFADESSVGVTCTGLAATTMLWSARISGRGILI
jgi:hypothetical protein